MFAKTLAKTFAKIRNCRLLPKGLKRQKGRQTLKTGTSEKEFENRKILSSSTPSQNCSSDYVTNVSYWPRYLKFFVCERSSTWLGGGLGDVNGGKAQPDRQRPVIAAYKLIFCQSGSWQQQAAFPSLGNVLVLLEFLQKKRFIVRFAVHQKLWRQTSREQRIKKPFYYHVLELKFATISDLG